MVGRAWYMLSSGCGGTGREAGSLSLRSGTVDETRVNDPRMRSTLRTVPFTVGGIPGGGRRAFWRGHGLSSKHIHN